MDLEIGATKRFSVYLTPRESYERNGFLILRHFMDNVEVKAILDELESIKKQCLKEKKLKPPPFRALGNAEVLNELRESCFGADIFGAPGNIDTIGHGLHCLENSVCSRFVRSGKVKNLINNLIDDLIPTIVQTKAVLKPAKTGSRVPPHMDEQYIYTEPLSGLALWIALDPSTKKNGCIEVVSGSHVSYQSGQKFADDGSGKIHWDLESPNQEEEESNLLPFPYSKKDLESITWVPIEMASGDCLVMHPRLLHSSAPNTSALDRRALTLHLVDGACHWDKRNWIQPHPIHGFSQGII